MIELKFNTGFVCPTCGIESTYKTNGLLETIYGPFIIEWVLRKLNREGGTFKSEECGHLYHIEPNSRKT